MIYRSLALAACVFLASAASAQVYVKRQSSTEWRVYQPVTYTAAPPTMPLWQVWTFNTNLKNGASIVYAGDVIGIGGAYCTHFLRGTDPVADSDWLRAWTHLSWVRYRAANTEDFSSWRFTPASLASGSVLTLTAGLNGPTVSYTCDASPTVAEATAGLTAAWNASTNAAFTPFTATDATTYVSIARDVAASPQDVVVPMNMVGTGTGGATLALTEIGASQWATGSATSGTGGPEADDAEVTGADSRTIARTASTSTVESFAELTFTVPSDWREAAFDATHYTGAALTVPAWTITPGGTIEVGDIFSLAVTGPDGATATVSFTATGTTVANVTAGLTAAWNASTANPCTSLTATDNTTTVGIAGDSSISGYSISIVATTTETGGGAADLQTLAAASTTNTSACGTQRFEFFVRDGSLWRRVALNGRGICTQMHGTSSTTPGGGNHAGACVRTWDARGVLDWAPAVADRVLSVEYMRNLKPGTYKFRMVKNMAGGGERMYIGRARLRRQDASNSPANAREHMSETAYIASESTQPKPGPLGVYHLSSLDAEIFNAADANAANQYANGPNYGWNHQESFAVTADGADITSAFTGLATGSVLGPYASVLVNPVDHILRAESGTWSGSAFVGASGTAAEVDGLTNTIVCDAGANLSTLAAGDFLRLVGRTDGIDGGSWYEIASVDDTADTITIDAEDPLQPADTGITWYAREAYVLLDKRYTFAGGKMDCALTFDWLKTGTVSILYSPSIPALQVRPNDTYFSRMPRHPWLSMPLRTKAVFPYAMTRLEYIDSRLGATAADFRFTLPSESASASDAALEPDVDALRSTYRAPSMAGNGVLATRRVMHWDGIEGCDQREVGRKLIIDTDYSTWINTEYAVASDANRATSPASWHTGPNPFKTYVQTIESLGITAGSTSTVVTFSARFAERAWGGPRVERRAGW